MKKGVSMKLSTSAGRWQRIGGNIRRPWCRRARAIGAIRSDAATEGASQIQLVEVWVMSYFAVFLGAFARWREHDQKERQSHAKREVAKIRKAEIRNYFWRQICSPVKLRALRSEQ